MANTSFSSEASSEKVTSLFAKQNLHDVPAKRINDIPGDERIASLQDLHGASDLVEETLELKQNKLLAMNTELLSLEPNPETQAYFLALCQSLEYVQSLRIVFLRAEQWNEKKAAQRMIQHFATKLKLFQRTELLGRPIHLKDLENNPDDELAIRAGIVQFLPRYDQVGRAILCMNPGAAGFGHYPIGSLLRVIFWLSSLVVLHTEDVQRKGLVLIWYGVGKTLEGNLNMRGNLLFGLFPTLMSRVSAIHTCFDCPRFKMIFDFMGSTIESRYLLRWVTHYGSHLECKYNLMTFGIPPRVLPVDSTGTWQIQDHQAFIRQQRVIGRGASIPQHPSTISRDFEIADPVGNMDIMMGRGNRGTRGLGNVRLKKQLEEKYEEYNQSTRSGKTALTCSIYRQLVQQGYRFVSPHPDKSRMGMWIKMDEISARDRISHGFRNLRLSKK